MSEHWGSDAQMEILRISNYSLLDKYSRKNLQHGGTAIFVRNNIDSQHVKLSGLTVEGHIEMCSVSFYLNEEKIALLSVYRPPSGCYDTFLVNMSLALTKLSRISKYVVVVGDLNVDFLKKSPRLDRLLDVFQSHGISCLIKNPTRIFVNGLGVRSESAIDYVATSIPHTIQSCYSVEPNLGDHLAQVLEIRKQCSSESSKCGLSLHKIRSTNIDNVNELKLRLRGMNWNDVYNSLNVNDACRAFMDSVAWCFDISCPYKIKRYNQSVIKTREWISAEIVHSSGELRELFWLKNRLNSDTINNLYAIKKKEHSKLVSKTKQQYYENAIRESSNKTKTLWKIVNDRLDKRRECNVQLSIKHNNALVTDPKEVCEIFGEHFSIAASSIVNSQYGDVEACNIRHSGPSGSFSLLPVCRDDIVSIIRKLPSKKSCGDDEISTFLLKQLENELVDVITFMINMSFAEGTFPTLWKMGSVLPVFKKGNINEVENYRPISILSSFSKIIERIVFDQLMVYLTKFRFLTQCQHGFRKQRSTETALVDLLQYVYDNIDRGKYVAAIFFDLARAFDCVNSDVLCDKLQAVGIRGIPLKWIKSYLSERKMRVRLDNVVSSEYETALGVPQGSVLGPLLFLLAINDLPEALTVGYTILFADDTSVAVSSDTPGDLLLTINRVVGDMAKWCDQNQLVLNADKTTVMYFHRRRELSGHVINFAPFVKVLGVTLDESLTWEAHIDSVAKKLNSAYYAIMQLKTSLSIKYLKSVYYAMVYSVLSYNVIVWGQAIEWKRVFISQKRILRLIYNLGYNESCRNTFRSSELLTFPSIYIYKCATFMKENPQKFQKYIPTHSYSTRNCGAYSVPQHTLTLFRRSPEFACISIYNGLPDSLKELTNINIFKNKLREYLVRESFYDLKEFLK